MSNFIFQDILIDGIKSSASDIHIGVGSRPAIRINGTLTRRLDSEILDKNDMNKIIDMLLNADQKEIFLKEHEYDFSFTINYGTDGNQRFRANFSLERGNPTLALRIITPNIRTIKQLCLPAGVKDMANRFNGLFIVTGPTGSGKSTTLAAVVQEINMTRPVHIITIEDPIEYVYDSAQALIHQREVGSDTKSFSEALRRAMRQDPDVILIGELRDLETIAAAVTAAETGHLVLATLHTPDAPQSVDRIIDVFPPFQQQQIRIQLSSILIGILSQQLVPLKTMAGRMVATEFLIANNAVRNHIREGKTAQIKNTLQTGSALGMHTMDQDLARMHKEGLISRQTALAYAYDSKDIERYLSQKMSEHRGFLLTESLVLVFFVLIINLLVSSSLSAGNNLLERADMSLRREYIKEEVISLLLSGTKINDLEKKSGFRIKSADALKNSCVVEIHVTEGSMRKNDDVVIFWPKTGS